MPKIVDVQMGGTITVLPLALDTMATTYETIVAANGLSWPAAPWNPSLQSSGNYQVGVSFLKENVPEADLATLFAQFIAFVEANGMTGEIFSAQNIRNG